MPKFEVRITVNIPYSKCFTVDAEDADAAEQKVLQKIHDRVAGTNPYAAPPYEWDREDPTPDLMDEDRLGVDIEEVG